MKISISAETAALLACGWASDRGSHLDGSRHQDPAKRYNDDRGLWRRPRQPLRKKVFRIKAWRAFRVLRMVVREFVARTSLLARFLPRSSCLLLAGLAVMQRSLTSVLPLSSIVLQSSSARQLLLSQCRVARVVSCRSLATISSSASATVRTSGCKGC